MRELMWPRLIASKILRKRIGSNNFVADFPSSAETWLQLPEFRDTKCFSTNSILTDHEEIQNYKVFVSTWNVGGVSPTEDLDIQDWLEICRDPCDIYVFGFQEVVPLRASSVFGSENRKITMQWNSLIRKALNKKSAEAEAAADDYNKEGKEEDYDDDDDDHYHEYCKKMIMSPYNDQSSPSPFPLQLQRFRCIISKQMVGILISVWIRSDLRTFVRNPSVSCVGCGIMGCLGNKGSVSVRFRLHETSFCFVCSHLASGGRGGDEKQRNSNASEILSRTFFPRGPSLDLPRKILDHELVVWLGDLNYRISLPESKTRVLVDKGEWDALLENDQLKTELMDGQVFEGWHEGTIEFAPTYKYFFNSDEYYGHTIEGKKCDKKRAPAWCDRIIWLGDGLKQQQYKRGESKLSDHRPVKATFSSEVRVSRNLKQVQNFFLSDRFEQITNRLDQIHSGDDNNDDDDHEFPCNARKSFQF